MKKIYPIRQIEGRVIPPSDKSIFHRAILLNAMAKGKGVIEYNTLGEDIKATLSCVEKLSATVVYGKGEIEVYGIEKWQNATLDCQNSATTMRLLTGILAGKGVKAKLIGDASLLKRPMDRVISPLTKMGANLLCEEGYPPIRISPSTLTGAEIRMQTDSAQVKSAILLAGLSSCGKTEVIEKIPTRNHTEIMLSQMGANILVKGKRIQIEKSELIGTDFSLPADISSAAYFIALGVLCGKIEVENVCLNPYRVGFLEAIEKMGGRIEIADKKIVQGEMRGKITATKSRLTPLYVSEEEIPSLIDEIPLLAVLCTFAEGESRLCGLKELRYKESDRLLETAKLLRALGGECYVDGDDFIIQGKPLVGGNYSSCDHRMMMTACVGLCASERGGVVDGEDCVGVSFPQFFEVLQKVGGRVE